MAKADLTLARLCELLHYDQSSGVFTWLRDPCSGRHGGHRAKVGAVAGSVFKGYRIIGIDGEHHRAHRLAWFYVHGEWPAHVIDHIDGDRLNNRISNLRDVPSGINSQNMRRAARTSKSGLLGASWSKVAKKWAAQIRYDSVQHGLGYFDTPEEAHAAYVAAKRLRHKGCTI